MAQPSPEPGLETVRLDVGVYSYSDGRLCRTMLTVSSRPGSHFEFAPARVDIRSLDSVHVMGLTEQVKQLVAEVRHAPASYNIPTELIRLTPHSATFGPYQDQQLAELTATVLSAIRSAYLSSGRLRLTFLTNWPERLLNQTLARLKQPACAEYLASIQVDRPMKLRSAR